MSPELADGRSGLNPAGTADSVFVVDLVFGTDERREDANCPPAVVGDVEPAYL